MKGNIEGVIWCDEEVYVHCQQKNVEEKKVNLSFHEP